MSDLHSMGRWCTAEVDAGLLFSLSPQITHPFIHTETFTQRNERIHLIGVCGNQLQQAPVKVKRGSKSEAKDQAGGGG